MANNSTKVSALNRFVDNPYSSLAVILTFLVLKLFHLNISFFWDESWVYAPALRNMALGGPSLFPDSIPLEYSRGHPLLFHFLGGIWIKIFGETQISMHGFALLVSASFLFILRSLFEHIWGWWISFWILLVLCVQPIFIAQSSMVLPEIMLAAMSAGALNSYIRKKYWFYVLFATGAILTKETGIIVILAIMLFEIVRNVQSGFNFKTLLKIELILGIPVLALILHMLYCKYVFGWYLYPEHTGLLKQELYPIFISFGHAIQDQVFIQYRWILSSTFMILYAIKMVYKKSFFDIIFLFSCIILGLFLYTFSTNISFSIIFTCLILHYVIDSFIMKKENSNILLLFVLFAFFYSVFSAANFYTVRYLLSTLVFLLAIPVIFLLKESIFNKYSPILIILALLLPLYSSFTPEEVNDVNLSYLNYCPLQQECINYFEENELYDEQINTGFLMSVALNDKLAGYRNTNDSFSSVNQDNNNPMKYFVFYNVEPNSIREKIKNQQNSELIKRLEKGNIWFEIWKQIN